MRYGRVILKEVLGDDGVKPWEVKMWDGSTGEIPLDLPPVDFGHSVPNISLKYLVSVSINRIIVFLRNDNDKSTTTFGFISRFVLLFLEGKGKIYTEKFQ